MRHGAQARIGQRDFVFIGFDVGLHLGKRRRREVFACEQSHGHISHLADVLEVFERIVGQLLVQRRRRGHAHVVQKDGVTVGRGARHLARANRATCAHRVFNQHGLAERLAHRDGDHAGHHVSGASSGEGNDQADGFVGVGPLRQSGCRGGKSCNHSGADQQGSCLQCRFHKLLQRWAVQTR